MCNDYLCLQSHQCVVVAKQSEPVDAVLLSRRVAALLFVDGISFSLGQAEEPADHAQVLPEGPVLWTGILLPAQQLTEPALQRRKTPANPLSKTEYTVVKCSVLHPEVKTFCQYTFIFLRGPYLTTL